jgi:hypothetical protein
MATITSTVFHDDDTSTTTTVDHPGTIAVLGDDMALPIVLVQARQPRQAHHAARRRERAVPPALGPCLAGQAGQGRLTMATTTIRNHAEGWDGPGTIATTITAMQEIYASAMADYDVCTDGHDSDRYIAVAETAHHALRLLVGCTCPPD